MDLPTQGLYQWPAGNVPGILQDLMNQVTQNAPQIIQQEIIRQSPEIGFQGKFIGGKWVEKK